MAETTLPLVPSSSDTTPDDVMLPFFLSLLLLPPLSSSSSFGHYYDTNRMSNYRPISRRRGQERGIYRCDAAQASNSQRRLKRVTRRLIVASMTDNSFTFLGSTHGL